MNIAKFWLGGGFWKTRERLGLFGHRVALGVAAIWDARKGLSDLFKVEGCQVIVVGLSERQKSCIPSNMMGYTKTNNVEELRKLYAVADVFVNPTYEDNFPTTNIEALACGTPVITYRTGGSPEAVAECGFVVDKGDIVAMNQRIIEISAMVQECRDRSVLYNIERMKSEYAKHYTEVIL